MNRPRFDCFATAAVVALWTWKLGEYVAREAGLLERNLGWGFSVDLTLPLIAMITLLLFKVGRRLRRRLIRRPSN